MTLRTPQLAVTIQPPEAMLYSTSESSVRLAYEHLSAASFDANNPAVRVAVDRLAGLGTRTQIADQLVDVLIACEAFFTLGSESRTELAFRAALNAAALSSEIGFPMQSKDVLALLLSAYNLRSKIVHGSPVRDRDLRHLGKTLDLGDGRTSAPMVRRGILWSFGQCEPDAKIEIDWESLYFCKRASSPGPIRVGRGARSFPN